MTEPRRISLRSYTIVDYIASLRLMGRKEILYFRPTEKILSLSSAEYTGLSFPVLGISEFRLHTTAFLCSYMSRLGANHRERLSEHRSLLLHLVRQMLQLLPTVAWGWMMFQELAAVHLIHNMLHPIWTCGWKQMKKSIDEILLLR